MITAATLREYRLKELAQMAKERGVSGWHTMRKDELVHALVRQARRHSRNSNGSHPAKDGGKPTATSKSPLSMNMNHGKGTSSHRAAAGAGPNGGNGGSATATVIRPKSPTVRRRIQQLLQSQSQQKDLSRPPLGSPDGNVIHDARDRMILMVRDPHWLHAYWEISSRSVARAEAALAELWHTARPVLRIFEMGSENNPRGSERIIQEIEVHGGVQHWYVHLRDTDAGAHAYRAELGYMSVERRFQALVRSNIVTPPAPGSGERIDRNWSDVADDCERIFALSGGNSESGIPSDLKEIFEERFQRPMGSPMVTRFGMGAEQTLGRPSDFHIKLDAEMIVFGVTKPDAHVAIGEEPVKIREDGTFSIRVGLPERRQVLPIVASSGDGMYQQTIVLAVERNTKIMEPVGRDEE